MKNKKLAELLGIKSKWIAWVDNTCDPLASFPRLERQAFDTLEEAESSHLDYYGTDVEEVNVDFTQPDNFVKLLKLRTADNFVIGDYFITPYHGVWQNENPEKRLIECLVRYLEKQGELKSYRSGEIPRYAQQVEWRY